MHDAPISYIEISTDNAETCCFGYAVNSLAEQVPNWLSNNGLPTDLLDHIRDENTTIAFLNSIYVDTNERNDGRGNHLISEFFSVASEVNADYIVLVCGLDEIQDEGFDLIRWYSGHGFTILYTEGSSNPVMINEI